MVDITALEETTADFFFRHWSSDHPPGKPVWTKWPEFLQGSVPSFDLGGCYALFIGEELVYVGVGVSKGGGNYPEHGISRRLMGHVISGDKERGRQWYKLQDPWKNVSAIYTIGFPNEASYLAPALESYLIRELSPPKNSCV